TEGPACWRARRDLCARFSRASHHTSHGSNHRLAASLRPTLCGTAVLVVPPAEKRDVWAVGDEDRH
ncbi:MAG: hypothetical protein M3364_09545, partial [Actinomycetota bacterium]|nr:hypothetical protein [Actinomycetota bacterium]